MHNYRIFREWLSVPLVAVELACSEQFELQEGDAEILIQLRGRDAMWQKERLLNIALGVLPTECRYVALLDCDVVFARRDWPGHACELLEKFAIVHFQESVHRVNRWATPGVRSGRR